MPLQSDYNCITQITRECPVCVCFLFFCFTFKNICINNFCHFCCFSCNFRIEIYLESHYLKIYYDIMFCAFYLTYYRNLKQLFQKQ